MLVDLSIAKSNVHCRSTKFPSKVWTQMSWLWQMLRNGKLFAKGRNEGVSRGKEHPNKARNMGTTMHHSQKLTQVCTNLSFSSDFRSEVQTVFFLGVENNHSRVQFFLSQFITAIGLNCGLPNWIKWKRTNTRKRVVELPCYKMRGIFMGGW